MARAMHAPARDLVRPAYAPAPYKLVYPFAITGLLVLLMALHTWGAWIASPDFKPSPMGPDPLPAHVYWTLRIVEVTAVTVALVMVWKFMIEPWRRAGHITWDGRFMIAGFVMWVTDPVDNYFNFSFMYNTGFFNMASWSMHIPGWSAPNQNLFPEPLFFVGGLYIWWFIGPTALGCWALRKLSEFQPRASIMSRLLILFGALMVFDFVIENIFERLQVFEYVGTYGAWTAWAGTPYQYPLYNSVMMAAFFMGMICLRYFKDDNGNSFAERGIDQLKLPSAANAALRQFAMIGALFLNISIFYFTPYAIMSFKIDSFPKYPSYLMAEICGPGTAYACPGRQVPIPKRGSLAIAPNDPRLQQN